MKITIKPVETESEILEKSHVHWKAWHQEHDGLLDQNYLDTFTLDKFITFAYRWQNGILIAKYKGCVIGFIWYGMCSEPLSDEGEIYALYILKNYYKKNVDSKLLRIALGKLSKYRKIVVWVNEYNHRSIKFYKKCGFKFDGAIRRSKLDAKIKEFRMVWNNNG